jgi:hypothetical protein
MKNKGLFIIGIILVLSILSCSKILYTNFESKPELYPSKDFVFLSISEEVPSEFIKVADFEYKESWSVEYEYLLNNVKKIALEKNANILKVKEVHTGNMKTKGAAIRILGSIYISNKPDLGHYLDSLNKVNFIDKDKIMLYFYRTDYGGPSLYDINIYINSESYGKLEKRDFQKIELDKDGEIIISNSQKTNNGLKIKVEYGKKYFINATQIVNSMSSSNSIYIGIGGQEFLLKNEKQGLFEYDVVKFRIENGYK